MKQHEYFMQRAIELSQQGLGHVAPNPLVGCVIVYNSQIIAEGYHYQYGGPHAEIVAMNRVKDKQILSKATMYVTLEPCSHYGKTPPCADAIINAGIPQVVIASIDPNPLIAGNGIHKLKKAGVDVLMGIGIDTYRFVNRRFFTFFEKKRPYIILKWAETIDKFIDIERNTHHPEIHWISNSFNRLLVHQWRSQESAILIGDNTVIKDNPQLTNRMWPGKNPIRVILNFNHQLPDNAMVFDGASKTLVFTNKHPFRQYPNAETIIIEQENVLPVIMQELYKRNIQSVIVEGGFYTLNQFIHLNLWDEARVITGNKYFFKGVPSPELSLKPSETYFVDKDILQIYFNT